MKLKLFILPLLACLSLPIQAQEATPKYSIDVTGAGLKPIPALPNWGGTNAAGDKVTATNYNIELNGKPLAFIMGEFHFQRYPQSEWEDAIIEIKAGGINTISSYLFWNMIEPFPNQFNFEGRNDFRAFIELCKKHNMRLIPRIGPFVNAEVMLGGLPPWLFGMPYAERSNDPEYLAVVKRLYGKLAEQMKGLYWQEGGPIFYVQLENELTQAPNGWQNFYRNGVSNEYRGPEGTEWTKHYLELRKIAQSVGICPLFFSATAWGIHGEFPEGFLPMYGGYMYLGPPDPKHNHPLTVFQRKQAQQGKVPVGFCELGAAGTPARINYHITPPALSAPTTAMTAFGGIETLTVGYYMYHGGNNPVIPRYGFTHSGDGFPYISYDYRAPVSEFGETRPAYFLLRPLHQFVTNYADVLGNGECKEPKVKEKNPDDPRLRIMARSIDNRGFLFGSYYGNSLPFPDNKVQVEIMTGNGPILMPRTGTFGIKNGNNFAFPFNLALDNQTTLISATAQPTSIVKAENVSTRFFVALNDQSAEFVFSTQNVKSISIDNSNVKPENDVIVCNLLPDRSKVIRITNNKGEISQMVLLSENDAQHSLEASFGGQKYLFISNEDIATTATTIELSKCSKNDMTFWSFPKLKNALWNEAALEPVKTNFFTEYQVSTPAKTVEPVIKTISDFKSLIRLPENAFDDVNDIYMTLAYDGIICRIFDIEKGELIADEFGSPWRVGLRRYKSQITDQGLLIRVSKHGNNKGVPKLSADGMTMVVDKDAEENVKLKSINFEPEYKVVLTVK